MRYAFIALCFSVAVYLFFDSNCPGDTTTPLWGKLALSGILGTLISIPLNAVVDLVILYRK